MAEDVVQPTTPSAPKADAPVAQPTAQGGAPAQPTEAARVEAKGDKGVADTAPSSPQDPKEAPKTDASQVKTEPQKTDGEKPNDGNKSPEEPKYEFKYPDGSTVFEDVANGFKELAKAEKLSPEVAQKIVDFAPKLSERLQQENVKQWSELNKQWQDEVRADPEIGGKNFDATMANVNKIVDRYAASDKANLLQAFALTGAGNNPAIVKFIARMAKDLSEPAFVPAQGVPKGKKSSAETLYPSMNKNTA